MQSDQLRLLCCPKCRADLEEREPATLTCTSCGTVYPVINGIPRFVPSENYAASFGFQWTKFSKVQLDSYNHAGFSEQRFRTITGWKERDLWGKLVLDAGCGAGRFAEVVVNTYGANLVAFDLSNAVEACRANLAPHDPLICQASIYEPPFREGLFDFVYCIGVIQHTPDPFESIRSLGKLVKPGGKIGLWIYELNAKALFGTLGFKYALRPITRRLSIHSQVAFSQFLVNLFYPIISVVKNWGWPGRIVMRLLPVSSAHLQSVKLRPSDFKTWLFLDTFDMYSPAYDQPQRYASVARLLAEQGFEDIQRHPHGAISITAIRRR